MNQQAIRGYQRIRHYQGERLLAPDLQDEFDAVSRLRGLHVVGLHDTWGIALGLAVHAGPGGSFVVAPGLAYDALGREVLVGNEAVIMGPQHYAPGAPDGEWELWLRYREVDQPLEGFLCEPAPAELRWLRAGEGRLGIDVPLAAVTLDDGEASGLRQDNRYYVRPLSRPHIASGRTPNTQRWSLWTSATTGGPGLLLGLQTIVDTSAAGFVGSPRYVTTLHADPTLTAPSTGGTAPGGIAQIRGHVSSSQPGHFVYRLLLSIPGRGFEFAAFSRAVTTTIPFPFVNISWMGVEPLSGCEPFFDVGFFFLHFVPVTALIQPAFFAGVNFRGES